MGGKVVRCVGLSTLRPTCALCLRIWEPQSPENLWTCKEHARGLLYLFIISNTLRCVLHIGSTKAAKFTLS